MVINQRMCGFRRTHIYAHKCEYIYIYINTSMHTCIHACIHASMHPCIHASMHPCIHPSIHPDIHACMHTYVRTYVHTCIHTYIHTYMKSFRQLLNSMLRCWSCALLKQPFCCTSCIVVLPICCLNSWLPGWLKALMLGQGVDHQYERSKQCWCLTPLLDLVLHTVARHFITFYMLNWNCINGYVEVDPVHFTIMMLTEGMSVDQMLITVFLICPNHLLMHLSVVLS